ncbi:MAG: hypothetical protein AAGJ50_10450, partial [Pseudomonadota bacterium]
NNGSIEVDGALVQGGAPEGSDAELTLTSSTDILISSVDEERRGVLFSSSGSLELNANANIINTSGRLISNSSIAVEAGGLFDNRLGSENQSADDLLSEVEEAGRSRSSFEISFGEAPVEGLDAVLTAQGDISISAGQSIRNFGGELNANDGNVRLSGTDVLLQSRAFGDVSYQRSCFVFCRASGSSNVETVGGTLSASGRVVVEGTDSFLNLGGFITGLEGIDISAPDIAFQALLLPDFITRPTGLHNFFTGSTEILLFRDVQGGVFGGDGEIVLTSATPVRLIGVTLDESQLSAVSGLDVSQQDRTNSPIFGDNIGLFGLGF